MKVRIEAKRIHRVIDFNQSLWHNPYAEFNTQKRKDVEKNRAKDGKVLYRLMNNAVTEKQSKI